MAMEKYSTFLMKKRISDEEAGVGQSKSRFFPLTQFTNLAFEVFPKSFCSPDQSRCRIFLTLGAMGPNSCSSTATYLVRWLCDVPFSFSTPPEKHSFDELEEQFEVCRRWTTDALMVICSPNHKFCILRTMEGQGCVLQSNQDEFTYPRQEWSTTAFTLQEYLSGPTARQIKFSTDDDIRSFILDMKVVQSDAVDCESFFYRHFGIAFRHSKSHDGYWFSLFPVTQVV